MKQYPSISGSPSYGGNWYVFDKLDGSNIRAEWSRKKGFYKFGSRKQLIGTRSESDQQTLLSEAIELVRAKEDSLAPVFRKERYERAVCFFEFFGESSFAGLHEHEPHCVVLIDVDVHKRGMMDPRDFISFFGGVTEIPQLLSRGSFSKEMEADVRAGTLDRMSYEGVVAKAPRAKKWSTIPMFKVKNRAWVDKVKSRYGEGAEAL